MSHEYPPPGSGDREREGDDPYGTGDPGGQPTQQQPSQPDPYAGQDPYAAPPPGQQQTWGQPDYGQQPYGAQQPYGGQQQYGQQPPAGGGFPPSGQSATTTSKGFFGALFDFSFNSFVTPKIVKVAYVLAVVALALIYLVVVIAGFAGDSPILGVVWLLLGWIPFLLYLALIRMTLELYFSLVRMSEDIHHRLPPR